MKSPEKWIAALILLALGVAGTGIFLALRPQAASDRAASEPTSTSDPQSGNAITALGRLEPGGEIFCVAPPSSAGGSNRVLKLMIQQGDAVKQNQVIAVMDTYERLTAAAMQAQAQVNEARTRVSQVQAGSANEAEVSAQREQVAARGAQVEARQAEVLRRDAEFKNAASEFKRYEDLFKQGAISESDLDRRKLSLQTAFAALEQAVKERDQAVKELDQSQQVKTSLTQARPVDVQQAEAQVQTAMATLERAKAELETSAVRSPINGRVLKVHAKEGEQVRGSMGGNTSASQTCEGIAELGRTEQMYAVAEVYETDVTRIRRGQRAIVTSPAFPDKLSGTVEQVGLKIGKKDVLDTDPAADTDARVVEVKVRLDDSRPVTSLTNLQVNVAIAP